MFDGRENFSGIRLRADDASKWALRGSHQGIFVPDMKPQEEALVVEGPTDAAAAASLGLYAIGRPSCSGGAREIAEVCRRRGIKRLSILADNDGPGIRGARKMCRHVNVRSRVVVLPAKDLREWVRHGATRQAVEACLTAHGWR
jgi:5S rRNA maturation endonuclease (ribonuclease M5)